MSSQYSDSSAGWTMRFSAIGERSGSSGLGPRSSFDQIEAVQSGAPVPRVRQRVYEMIARVASRRVWSVAGVLCTWVAPDRAADAYISTGPYHFDRAFRTWK